ncbi:hypothetical protein [Haloarchaeobius iranensis]|uniref:Uncharacterized protein n=1 Tax=Haloarchaeobius iranensis TaxID=996166 RepID=A0A1H0B621_9EURY|nr:hypothetical protein [Haloarchaeobius iranensis]SDN41107.1 hypothetical protein SAMN05192554_13411 [Haloarchaeobius iranensis]
MAEYDVLVGNNVAAAATDAGLETAVSSLVACCSSRSRSRSSSSG